MERDESSVPRCVGPRHPSAGSKGEKRMSTILVVDDSAICREPIAEALRAHGYHVICAGDGSEALSVLGRTNVHLVLLDLSLPQLDGISVLRTMRRNHLHRRIPVIMLTGHAEKHSVLEAAKIGIQGYLLKSNFALDELLERVQACLEPAVQSTTAPATRAAERRPAAVASASAAATSMPSSGAVAEAPTPPPAKPIKPPGVAAGDLQPVITKSELIQLVNRGLELRPLGSTVQNIMAVSGNSSCTADDVAKALGQDQALSIRVLKLANSSAYSRGRPVESVKDAVHRIGISQVRSIVTTLVVLQEYEGGVGEHIDPRLFWEHSIACGLIAAAIAKAHGSDRIDECFLWGMVHDVGRLVLLEHAPDAYAQVWEAAQSRSLPLEAVEAKLVLLDHCAVLERALEHWQFPHDFVMPVVSHHRTIGGMKRLPVQHRENAMIIALANRLARAMLLGCSGDETIQQFDELSDELGVKPETLQQITDTVEDDTRDVKLSLVVRTNDEHWPDFRAQTRERFTKPFRPLCVSNKPHSDAYRIACEHLTERLGDDAPNVAVMYLRDARELGTVSQKLAAEEKTHNVAPLPALVICAKGDVDLTRDCIQGRRVQVLKTPVSIAHLIAVAEELVD